MSAGDWGWVHETDECYVYPYIDNTVDLNLLVSNQGTESKKEKFN